MCYRGAGPRQHGCAGYFRMLTDKLIYQLMQLAKISKSLSLFLSRNLHMANMHMHMDTYTPHTDTHTHHTHTHTHTHTCKCWHKTQANLIMTHQSCDKHKRTAPHMPVLACQQFISTASAWSKHLHLTGKACAALLLQLGHSHPDTSIW